MLKPPSFIRSALVATLTWACFACAPSPSSPVPPSHPLLGTFMFGTQAADEANAERFDAAVARFDIITLPVFLRLMRPTPGVEDFTLPDAVIDAAPPGTVFFVSGLVSNDLIPDWLQEAHLDGPALRAFIEAYVASVVRHFEERAPGRVLGYEIVLEPLSWRPGTGFWHRVGLDAGRDAYEYIRVAFHAAHEAAPDAVLYIDDFGVEGAGEKSDRYFELVAGLRAEGVPIGGVGVEGHFMLGEGGAFPRPPPEDEIVANLSRYHALGLTTAITSIDVALRNDGLTEADFEEQADAYASLTRACRRSGCAWIGTWGLGDTDSWIPQFFPEWGAPLLFDAQYVPKPAMWALQSALEEPL